MKRFAGLSLMCLMFLSTHACPEISGSSRSLQMSQNNDEPMFFEYEKTEYDETGEKQHEKRRGTIDKNGVVKVIEGPSEKHILGDDKYENGQDLRDSRRKSRDIDALLKLSEQYENKKKEIQKNKRKRWHHRDGFFGEGQSLFKYHPRRYGKRLKDDLNENFDKDELNVTHCPRVGSDFENEPKGKHHPRKHHGRYNPLKFLKKKNSHPVSAEFAKEGPRYVIIPDARPETTRSGLKNLLKLLRVKYPHRRPAEFAKENPRSTIVPDLESETTKNRLRNRSRVSFYRPVEKIFEKIFGIKKQDSENQEDFKRNLEIQQPVKSYHPEKISREDFSKRDNWFEDFERQNPEETEELLRSMQEFEDGFIHAYYVPEE